MRYSAPQYAAVLLSLVEESPAEERRAVMREFFRTLAAHGALPMLQDIVREVGARIDAEKNVQRVLIRSVGRENEESARRKLHFKADVLAIEDASVVGGAIVEMDGVRVDNSIARRFQRLREALVR